MDLHALFEPLQVGPMSVPNRLVMAPMERNYAHADGTVSERTLAHYARRAEGGVGWIDVESTFVDPVGRGRTHQLGLYDDRCVDGFRSLADRVHAAGARIGVELHHAGRNTSRAISGFQPVAPSPVPCPEAGGDVPRELTVPEIDAIVQRYAEAAARAAAAGFDAVELHSAHGYLPLAFLSPLTNLRTDEYGGSPAHRMRFALRVIAAMRSAVGEGVAVGCRFSADEHLPGGLTLEDTVGYARALEAAGVDYVSVSAGVYASFTRIIPPMDWPSGWLLGAAATIKEAVSVPVVGVSRITDPRAADEAVRTGQVDLVALGRALLTDPDLPRKALAGRHEEIVSCIGCNQGCEDRISHQRDVTCLVNPEVGREISFRLVRAERPKRVVVVGGGPAGMEAARVSGERGHRVVLLEREAELGGMARWAGWLPHREGWRTFVAQAERRLRAGGVELRLGEEAGPELLASLDADALVCATGARFEPELGVLERLDDEEPVSGHVVVVGAGAIGLGLASWLAARQASVTVVASDAFIADPPGQPGLVKRLLATGRVRLRPDREVQAVADGTVRLARSGAIGPLFEERLDGVSSVLRTDWRRSASELAWTARRFSLAPEVVEVGDCRAPRSVLEAVYEGACVGHSL
jgi:2,4-dienoyl-CoA reductase-like NADH-dependent reductase (Old Yellow Enzyme family)